jgi:hypothetical protein
MLRNKFLYARIDDEGLKVLATLAGNVINHWMVGQTSIYGMYGVGFALFCVRQYGETTEL